MHTWHFGVAARVGALVALIAHATATAQTVEDSQTLVLTALPMTYSLTSALVKDTGISVQNLPARGRRMNGLTNYFESRATDLNDTFARATAVISIGKLWRDDPLYTAARGANVRVVDIDATKPWSTSLEGVSVALEPVQDAPWSDEASEPERRPSVYFWLSPANAVRATEIIAGDLARLVPEDRDAIATNLQQVRRELLELKRDYEVKFAELPDVTVFSLAPEFVYLTSDMGLYVDGYFFKQDLDWTDDDLTAFGRYLADNDVPVVLHKYEPAESIVATIDTAGAKLVVLETLDAGVVENGQLLANSYFALLQSNLAAVYEALRDAQ